VSPASIERTPARPISRRAPWPAWMRWPRPAHTVLVDATGLWVWPAGGGSAQRQESLAAWLSAHPGERLRVRVGTELLRHLVIGDDAPPLPDDASRAAYARHQFVHHHGSAAQDWPLALWSYGAEHGAVALQGLDLASLRAEALRQRVRWLDLRPWWACMRADAALRVPELHRLPEAGLVVVEPRRACCLRLRRGRLVSLQARPIESTTWAGLAEMLREDAIESAAGRAAEPPPTWVAGYGLGGLGGVGGPDAGRPDWLRPLGNVTQQLPSFEGVGT